MSKPLTWPQWLNVIARNITKEHPYICCHLDGGYLDGGYIKKPSESYLEAVTGPDYASFRAKLETKIKEELAAIVTGDFSAATLSTKLGFPSEDGVKGRQDWLRSLKNI